MKKSPILEVCGLSKTFSEKKKPACDNISFNLYKGEITALIGENGAGKSTLVNMITGEIYPNSGTITLDGTQISAKRKSREEHSRIGQVHQHPVLAQELSFFTNIIAGKFPPPKIIHKKKEIERLKLLAKKYNLDIPLQIKSGKGTLLQQQNAELLAILQNKPKVIIIDEPAALLEKEWEQSFLDLLEILKKQGLAILLISHKIGELIPHCQHIITLKKGRRQEGAQNKNRNSDYSRVNQLPKRDKKRDHISRLGAMMECSELCVSDNHLVELNNISFSLFPKEIVAIEGSREAGLSLIESLFTGMTRFKRGDLIIKGKIIKKHQWTPSLFRKNGGAAIPAQRISEGCIPSASVSDNQIFSKETVVPFTKKRFFLSKQIRRMKVESKRRVFPFEGEAFQPLNQLSGGNIQRIILARELNPTPEILVISEPSRGLDEEGRQELFSQLIKLRNNGCAILLLSADFAETKILADRIFRIKKEKLVKVD